MAIIRDIEIRNFRAIRMLRWRPAEGFNCLVGPGDSGKSTVLNAIDFAIGARRQIPFTDADFHNLDTSNPIEIFVTLGALDDELMDLESYGYFFRGLSAETGKIEDETSVDLETVLTVRLAVYDDLEPQWSLYSKGEAAEGREQNLKWKHRQAIAPAFLGTNSAHHMAWGPRSILNKLSTDKAQAASALASAARNARKAFSEEGYKGVGEVLKLASEIAKNIGISVGALQALLDARGVSFTGGSIGLHDEKHIPLRNLGSGSSRLLVAGMQHSSKTSSISLIDEVEYGLEPFRIVRLLDLLGQKNPTPNQQVFLTTHSPTVLRELSAKQLNVVRSISEPIPDDETDPSGSEPIPEDKTDLSGSEPVPNEETDPSGSVTGDLLAVTAKFRIVHSVRRLGHEADDQATLRACADSFLSSSVIVCEGKTEIGLVRGFDLHATDNGKRSIISFGSHWADGGGDNMYKRALTFATVGYRIALFKDSDKEPDAEVLVALRDAGVDIFEWPNIQSTEEVVFASVPSTCISNILELAVETRGADSINAGIRKVSGETYNLKKCRDEFVDDMRPYLGAAAKDHGWFKDVDPAEQLMRGIIAPSWLQCGAELTSPINELWAWAQSLEPEGEKRQ